MLESIITDSNNAQPVEGAAIIIESSNKTATTGTSGFYYLTGIKAGNLMVTVFAEGYTPQTVYVKIIIQNIYLASKNLSFPAGRGGVKNIFLFSRVSQQHSKKTSQYLPVQCQIRTLHKAILNETLLFT